MKRCPSQTSDLIGPSSPREDNDVPACRARRTFFRLSSGLLAVTAIGEFAVGAGGTVAISLANPVSARWVRLAVTEWSNANPLGLGEFHSPRARGGSPRSVRWIGWFRTALGDLLSSMR
jgi:hypothetical protein